VQAAARIQELIGELKMRIPSVKLVVNRAPGGELNAGVSEEIGKHGFDLAGVVPTDDNVYEYDAAGRATVGLPDDSPARVAFFGILRRIAL
jgi:CO dehydrogenase maturation factor